MSYKTSIKLNRAFSTEFLYLWENNVNQHKQCCKFIRTFFCKIARCSLDEKFQKQVLSQNNSKNLLVKQKIYLVTNCWYKALKKNTI